MVFTTTITSRCRLHIQRNAEAATKQETSKCDKENIHFLTIYFRLYYFMVLWRIQATLEDANAIDFYNDLRV